MKKNTYLRQMIAVGGGLILLLLLAGCSVLPPSELASTATPVPTSAPTMVAGPTTISSTATPEIVSEQPPPILESVSWMLASYRNDTGDWTPALANAPISLTFADGEVKGSAGCNRYFSTYQIDGQSLTLGDIASTMMICSDDIVSQEQGYLADLSQAASFQVKEDTLNLYDAAATPILRFNATPVSATADETRQLIGPVWRWIETDMASGETVTAPSADSYTIRFYKNGTVTAHTECIDASGAFQAEQGALAISLDIPAENDCGEDSPAIPFLTELTFAGTYIFQGDFLFINQQMDGGEMKFIAP